MQKIAATLYCPNYNCQAPNPESHKYCGKCSTPLPKRYLWAVSEVKVGHKPGEILDDRYAFKQQQIWLDTKPGLLYETPTDIPPEAAFYLRLVPYQLHVPQPYDLILPEQGAGSILLLEHAPLNLKQLQSQQVSDALMPEITSVWQQASAMRQLNWLWQIAQLWQPLSSQGVASTLLNSQLVRVEGQLVRLLELQSDRRSHPTLQNLGQLWSKWAEVAQPEVSEFLKQLCHQLIKGKLQSPEQLVAHLDEGFTQWGATATIQIEIATLSDTGPSRRRNEDACYPVSGTVERFEQANSSEALPLAIVCDGIGGHEGGNVASQLAIETIEQRLQQLSLAETHPTVLFTELENAACDANDAISDRNDSEHRQERKRMGTTLVMALAQKHEVYITHVGDSRAYWIARTGCHQVTLDDDLASREVRLGYAFYRDALQHPTSGSLVQALGMSSSTLLHPTVQRFILDDEGVFLLCSDGLSDRDRVEEHWEAEILPLLDRQVDVATVAQNLVQIANTKNGHDNVTVGLLYYRVLPGPNHRASGDRTTLATSTDTQPSRPDSASALKTQMLPRGKSSPSILSLLIGILVLLGLGGLPLAYFSGWLESFVALSPNIATQSEPIASDLPPPVASPSPETIPSPPTLEARSLVQVKDATTQTLAAEPDPLLLLAGIESPQARSVVGRIPSESILQILGKQAAEDTERWLKLKVCSVPQSTPISPSPSISPSAAAPTPTTRDDRLVKTGDEGWIREVELLSVPLAELPLASNNCP